MPVETFTKREFEAALPRDKSTGDPLWAHAGLVDGEHTYHVDVAGTNKRILIRSSVGENGVSAGVGADSIRLATCPRCGATLHQGEDEPWLEEETEQ